MELIPMENINNQDWDKIINNFDTKLLFHQSAWLKFIEASQQVKINRLKIMEGNKIIGYFPYFLEKKGPFRILSSPRPGCNTPYMGPVAIKDLNQQVFLKNLDNYCKLQHIDQLEIASPYFKSEFMIENKFKCHKGITYIVHLFSDEEKMWKNLKGKCRTAIRKAIKNNLIAEDTNNPKIIDEYYNQLQEVFGKQKLVPTYPRERVAALFYCLKKEGLLFSLRIKYEDKIIATGFFPHDDKTVYFWGGASWLKYQYLCPNDLLHWTLIKLAAKEGLKYYDMGGAGSFKPQFGGEKIITHRWFKGYNPLAKIGRPVYQLTFKTLQKLRGFYKK